jgi:hypothetical protein
MRIYPEEVNEKRVVFLDHPEFSVGAGNGI